MIEAEATETKRDRVRRLVLHPLIADGMRFRHGTAEDVQRKHLDRLADELSYMSDKGLEAVRIWMRSHGDGAQRTFWPSMVAVLSTAEAFEPRALEELPALARWFGSEAGRAALAGDRLVAEFLFWQKFKRPPVAAQEKAKVAARAADWSRRVTLIEERVARGLSPLYDDEEWLRWYRSIEARVKALVDQRGEAA